MAAITNLNPSWQTTPSYSSARQRDMVSHLKLSPALEMGCAPSSGLDFEDYNMVMLKRYSLVKAIDLRHHYRYSTNKNHPFWNRVIYKRNFHAKKTGEVYMDCLTTWNYSFATFKDEVSEEWKYDHRQLLLLTEQQTKEYQHIIKNLREYQDSAPEPEIISRI